MRKTREKAADDPVSASDEHPVLIRLHELLVHQEQPNRLHQFRLAEAEDFIASVLTVDFLVQVLDIRREHDKMCQGIARR